MSRYQYYSHGTDKDGPFVVVYDTKKQGLVCMHGIYGRFLHWMLNKAAKKHNESRSE